MPKKQPRADNKCTVEYKCSCQGRVVDCLYSYSFLKRKKCEHYRKEGSICGNAVARFYTDAE